MVEKLNPHKRRLLQVPFVFDPEDHQAAGPGRDAEGRMIPPESNAGRSSGLEHHWVVAGIVSAAARFVPIPFVDDVIRTRCRLYVVQRTLAAHDRSELLDDLEPLYDDTRGGCLGGCLSSAASVPLKLLMFPVRKLVALVTSVRRVPLEIMRVVLLGRTLDRHLRQGNLDAATAGKLRVAFDRAFARMDFRVVRAATSDALSSVRGWKQSAMDAARQLIGRADTSDVVETVDAPVETGAANVQQALDRPDVLELFAEFDRRVDETLANL